MSHCSIDSRIISFRIPTLGVSDKVLDETGDYVEASNLSLLEFKHVLPSYFEGLCVSSKLQPVFDRIAFNA